MPKFTINDRIEITDIPRDSLNQLPGIRQKLVQLRNSSRLSKSKAAKFRETLQFLVDSLSEPAEEPDNVTYHYISSSNPISIISNEVIETQVETKKPVKKTTGSRKATAKVDKAKV